MDVRSIEDVAPVVEHNGTVPVWWLVSPREMQEITAGGHLELVSEFEVAGGGVVDPHSHPTHEFYYVTAGRGLMTIGDETREIAQGDLVHIPPDAVHSLRPVSDHAPIHCFCFAVAVPGAGEIDYTDALRCSGAFDQPGVESELLDRGRAGAQRLEQRRLLGRHASGRR